MFVRRALLFSLFALSLPVLPAAAWQVRGDATQPQFEAFARRFAVVSHSFPRHGAAPLGITGFDVYADVAYDGEFGDDELASGAVRGGLPDDAMVITRIGARKGLPGGFDLGASVGEALDGDLRLVSADVQWAILKGGPLKPALSLRISGTETQSGGAFTHRALGAEVLASKGFAILTPYVGAGVIASRAKLDRPRGLARFEDEHTQTVVFVGATLNLLLPKFTAEVERSEDTTQYALRVAFGF